MPVVAWPADGRGDCGQARHAMPRHTMATLAAALMTEAMLPIYLSWLSWGAERRAVWPLRPVVLNAATRTVPRKGIGPRTSALRTVGSLPSVAERSVKRGRPTLQGTSQPPA